MNFTITKERFQEIKRYIDGVAFWRKDGKNIIVKTTGLAGTKKLLKLLRS